MAVQVDTYHLDMSKPCYTANGIMMIDGWNGRAIEYKFIDAPPAKCACRLAPLTARRCPYSTDCIYTWSCTMPHRTATIAEGHCAVVP